MLYTMIRKAVEQAIVLPMSASTKRLLSTGHYSMVEELIEGYLSVQKLRMSITAAGRRILHQVGQTAHNVTALDVRLDFWRQLTPSLWFYSRAMKLYDDSQPLVSFRDITHHYRLLRQTLPSPYPDLFIEQQTNLRLI